MTDIRTRTSDQGLSDLLRREYEVEVPAHVALEVARRVTAAIESSLRQPAGSRGLARRKRVVVVLAIAAVVSTAAAGQVIHFFDGWGEEFDRVFAMSTIVDQSVVDDGYRVTLIRAYGDSKTVRLALVAEDLENRGWSEIAVGTPVVTDNDGRAYELSVGTYQQPSTESGEGWLQYEVPAGATSSATRHLTVTLDRLGVRRSPLPTLPSGEIDLDRVWTSVAGTWSFQFDLAFLPEMTAAPGVKVTVNGITVSLDELSVTPAATVGRLTFTGLPARERDWAWDPHLRIERDGTSVDLDSLRPGSVNDRLVFEAHPGFDDLNGTWVITIDRFHRNIPDPDSNATSEEESIEGPWVLTWTN